MKIRVIGGGLYGCHIALDLIEQGHDVVLHEMADRLFAGASGNMPARLHRGVLHYPRSWLTRAACREHVPEFEARYGAFVRSIPANIYAIAEHDSLIDFGTYRQLLHAESEDYEVIHPDEFGLQFVEGAVLTDEKHVLLDALRGYFSGRLDGHVAYNSQVELIDDPAFGFNIDCTFCAHDNEGIDRYEACLTVLLEGPADTCVTIMDGKFPSLYVWDEDRCLSSLTSAKWTPMAVTKTWSDANRFLNSQTVGSLAVEARPMLDQMAHFYPRFRDNYRPVDYRVGIRAMPRSAADARLVEVVRVGKRAVRVRAGKLDAIFHAARAIKGMLPWTP